jgi:hypothetical protein
LVNSQANTNGVLGYTGVLGYIAQLAGNVAGAVAGARGAMNSLPALPAAIPVLAVALGRKRAIVPRRCNLIIPQSAQPAADIGKILDDHRPHVRLSTGRPVSQYAGNEGCSG